jgi:hypothetical protein
MSICLFQHAQYRSSCEYNTIGRWFVYVWSLHPINIIRPQITYSIHFNLRFPYMGFHMSFQLPQTPSYPVQVSSSYQEITQTYPHLPFALNIQPIPIIIHWLTTKLFCLLPFPHQTPDPMNRELTFILLMWKIYWAPNSILIYIQQDATLHSLYLEISLHVSGGPSTHHQECIQLYLQNLVFVSPLLLSAAIAEELEPVWVCCTCRAVSSYK